MKATIAVLAAVIAVSARSEGMPLEAVDANKQVVRNLYALINAGHPTGLAELVSPGYVDPQGGRGPAAFVRNVEELRSGFPDIRFTVEDLIAEGDRVVARWSWVATHSGRFKTWDPTGRRITNSGIAIYQLEEGKVVRVWLETDRLGALQQMGVIPSSGAPAPPPVKR